MIKTLLFTLLLAAILKPNGDQHLSLTIPANRAYNYEFHNSVVTGYHNKSNEFLYAPTTAVPFACYEVTVSHSDRSNVELGIFDWCNKQNWVFLHQYQDVSQYVKNGEFWFRVIGSAAEDLSGCTDVFFYNFSNDLWDLIEHGCGTSELNGDGWVMFEEYNYENCDYVPTVSQTIFSWDGSKYSPVDLSQWAKNDFGACANNQWQFGINGNQWTAFYAASKVYLPKATK